MKRPDVEGIEARANAATAATRPFTAKRRARGPLGPGRSEYDVYGADSSAMYARTAQGPDAVLLAHARIDILSLSAYIRELDAVVDAARRVIQSLDSPDPSRRGEKFHELLLALAALDKEPMP